MTDAGAEKLKVFISYSRRDAAEFADELVAGLEVAGFAPFLDRHDIAAGEDWEARLGGLIAQSDTVVFVVSPEAVKSDRVCGRWTGRLNSRSGSCRLSSSRYRITTSRKSSGVCSPPGSMVGPDLRGHYHISPRHCGSTLTGFASTRD